MYYQNYEDYIRSILGYPVQMKNTYNSNLDTQYEYITQTPRYSSEILELYPEIYKIVNPMVCKICEANTKPITRELIDQMTEEIYLNLESEPTINEIETVNVRVNLPDEKNNKMDNRIASTKNNYNESKRSKEKNEDKREYRHARRNSTLQDLIKILILNQLLGGNVRPPRPNPPRPRPPFVGGPGLGNNQRPPIQPREFYNNILNN